MSEIDGIEASTRASTLAQILAPAAVDFSTLERRYGPLLELVRKLIGVVPNCDRYLEIWPTAFRSYNVMVPNFLNLPFFLWGVGAPKTPVSLAMYTSSRTASCMYCSAHTCSFALRRGAAEHKIAERGGLTAYEQAAIEVADAISRVPPVLTDAKRAALLRNASGGDAEWVVLGIAMMGFLNKMMDALGVELEAATVKEVGALIEPSGWTSGKHRVVPTTHAGAPARGDDLALKVGIVRLLPAALALDRGWTADVPSRWPAVGEFLQAHTGNDFPVLRHLTHARAIRALATIVRDNCAPSASRLGLDVKHSTGLVYATVVENNALAAQVRLLATRAGAADLDAVASFAAEPIDFDSDAAVERAARQHGAALVLAKAASYSPARTTPPVVEVARALPRDGIVELVSWLSVLQLLHRLSTFYSGHAGASREQSRRMLRQIGPRRARRAALRSWGPSARRSRSRGSRP
jgi:hypothetical protein